MKPITGRELIRQVLETVTDIDAPVYVKRGGQLKGVWFVGHEKKLGEGTILAIREVEP